MRKKKISTKRKKVANKVVSTILVTSISTANFLGTTYANDNNDNDESLFRNDTLAEYNFRTANDFALQDDEKHAVFHEDFISRQEINSIIERIAKQKGFDAYSFRVQEEKVYYSLIDNLIYSDSNGETIIPISSVARPFIKSDKINVYIFEGKEIEEDKPIGEVNVQFYNDALYRGYEGYFESSEAYLVEKFSGGDGEFSEAFGFEDNSSDEMNYTYTITGNGNVAEVGIYNIKASVGTIIRRQVNGFAPAISVVPINLTGGRIEKYKDEHELLTEADILAKATADQADQIEGKVMISDKPVPVHLSSSDPNYNDVETFLVEVEFTNKLGQKESVNVTVVFKPRKEEVVKEPELTLVKNISSLTNEEKENVVRKIKKSNPNFGTNVRIEVEENGRATLHEAGKPPKVFEPDKTVYMISVPKTMVNNVGSVNGNEIEKIKNRINNANGNIINESGIELSVDNKGVVSLRKTTEVEGSDDIVELVTYAPSETIYEVKNPKLTLVENKENLTSAEKNSILGKIKEANSENDLQDNEIEIRGNGEVVVTRGDDSKTITNDKTIVKYPQKTLVKNKENLTNEEKNLVIEKIKNANPENNLQDNEIEVRENGIVIITRNDSVLEIPQDRTVYTKKTIGVINPEKTLVNDPAQLTQEEKDNIKKKIKKNNPNLERDGISINVNPDGSVTLTDSDPDTDDVLIPKEKTVETIKVPKTFVGNVGNVSEEERREVENNFKKENPSLEDSSVSISVDDKGKVTITRTTPDEESGTPIVETVEVPSTKTVYDGKTLVGNPESLTEAEKENVKKKVKKGNPEYNKEGVEIEVSEDGSVTVRIPDKDNVLIPKEKTVYTISDPDKTLVVDLENLTEKEKENVKRELKKKNPNLSDDEISVSGNGTVTVSKDGSTVTITPNRTVYKVTGDNSSNPNGNTSGNQDKDKEDKSSIISKLPKTPNTGDKVSITDALLGALMGLLGIIGLRKREKKK